MRPEDRYDSLFQFYGWKYGVDWLLLKAQAKEESGFDPDIKSNKGALGISQFMKKTWDEWRDATPGIQLPKEMELSDPRDPEDAIRAQAAYMRWLLKQLDSDIYRALAAYNWGIGNVGRIGKDEDLRAQLPIATQVYLKRIEKAYEEYEQIQKTTGD